MEPRILIVEDNPVNQFIVRRILRKSGFESDIAHNGGEAVELLSRRRYGVVLMDVQMPGMDGFEATRIIRDPESGVLDHEVPVIAMTAYAGREDENMCRQAGMSDYISKPFDSNRLVDLVRKFLGEGQSLGVSPVTRKPPTVSPE